MLYGCGDDVKTFEDGYKDANAFMSNWFDGTDGAIQAVEDYFSVDFESNDSLTEYENGILEAIRDRNNISLAPKAVIEPDPDDIVYSVWGSKTCHKDTCRFITGTTKPKECVFSFTYSKAKAMGLKPCTSCFKAGKATK